MRAPTDIAQALADRLDAADHAPGGAGALLAPGCVYEFRGRQVLGREAILASYDDAHADAIATFDAVAYESAVRPDDRGAPHAAIIRYADVLTKHGTTHRHECEQRITVDPDSGLVVRIEHVDLPGERERLNAFLGSVGLASRGPVEG